MTLYEFLTLEAIVIGSYLIGVIVGYYSAPKYKNLQVVLTNDKQGCDIIA